MPVHPRRDVTLTDLRSHFAEYILSMQHALFIKL